MQLTNSKLPAKVVQLLLRHRVENLHRIFSITHRLYRRRSLPFIIKCSPIPKRDQPQLPIRLAKTIRLFFRLTIKYLYQPRIKQQWQIHIHLFRHPTRFFPSIPFNHLAKRIKQLMLGLWPEVQTLVCNWVIRGQNCHHDDRCFGKHEQQ